MSTMPIVLDLAAATTKKVMILKPLKASIVIRRYGSGPGGKRLGNTKGALEATKVDYCPEEVDFQRNTSK